MAVRNQISATDAKYETDNYMVIPVPRTPLTTLEQTARRRRDADSRVSEDGLREPVAGAVRDRAIGAGPD
jgi:hypothetical protein